MNSGTPIKDHPGNKITWELGPVIDRLKGTNQCCLVVEYRPSQNWRPPDQARCTSFQFCSLMYLLVDLFYIEIFYTVYRLWLLVKASDCTGYISICIFWISCDTKTSALMTSIMGLNLQVTLYYIYLVGTSCHPPTGWSLNSNGSCDTNGRYWYMLLPSSH